MVMDPVSRVSASSLAAATVLAVTNIDNPATELNARVGGTNGALCIVTQNVVGINEWTVYCFDSASSGSVNVPYVVAASGSGQWIAVAGKYQNSIAYIAGGASVGTGFNVTAGGAAIVGGLQVSGVTSASSVTTAGGYTSTVATGTAPFTATSTTVCPNLNVSQLLGGTWAAPGTIGSGTPSTGAFTTLSASGVITSTLANGTAPFTVASSTVVGNLNVSQLLGGTWTAPGTIGSGTPSTGAFTTLTTTGNLTLASTGSGNATVKVYTNAARNGIVSRFNDSNEQGGFYVASSGQVFFGVNVDISGGNETFSRASVAAGRWGNPNGTSNYGFEVNVSPAGSAAATITWTRAFFVQTLGSCVFGPLAAVATNATDGFAYIPTCAGTPTGVPTTHTGKCAIVVDTTNHKLYFYDGSWRDAGP